ncbi:MAG: hypothetical protein K0B81_00765 [Candidatus Cloacimonetes bacterium]|nr:hypothetical protein [Candidatus Cloacimonadota bacterium]
MTYPYASNTYVGWDFVDTWQEDPLYLNDGYPYLEWQTFEIYPEAEAPTAGDGTPSNPYEISSLENLYWIAASEDVVPDPDQATRWSSHYIQIADIDASSTSGWFAGQGWTPIGDNSDISNETRFTGTYDGQDYTINGLFINRPDMDHVGLFGYASGSLLENIGTIDFNINGHYYVGGLVGMTESYTLISNCFSDGIVNGDYYVGGLVGAHTFHSTVSNSFSSCNVSGYSEVGGLSGRTAQSTHSNSYSISSVGGNSYVGGFIGRDLGYCTIVNCYSKGSVNGISWVGGFIGHQFGTTFTNCYWDMETSGQPSSAAGEGRTTEEMTYTYAANTYVDWDFINTWKADPQYLNDGYPYLHWQDSGIELLTPENLITNIADGYIYLHWEAVENANSYKVYACYDPYSEDWQLLDVVHEPIFSESISGAMKFYRIVASTETME